MDLTEKKCDNCHRHKLQLWKIKITGQNVCKRCYHAIYQKHFRAKREAEALAQGTQQVAPVSGVSSVGGDAQLGQLDGNAGAAGVV